MELIGRSLTSTIPLLPVPVATMAFGPTANQLILFGGFGIGALLNDTWSWDGALTWTQLLRLFRFPSRSPSSRPWPMILSLIRMILFGGTNLSWDLNDTWSWDGTTWTATLSFYFPSCPLSRFLCPGCKQ